MTQTISALDSGEYCGCFISSVRRAGTKGYLDKIAVKDVGRFEAGLLKHLRTNGKAVLEMITKEDPKIKGEAEDKIKAAIDAFAKDFA